MKKNRNYMTIEAHVKVGDKELSLEEIQQEFEGDQKPATSEIFQKGSNILFYLKNGQPVSEELNEEFLSLISSFMTKNEENQIVESFRDYIETKLEHYTPAKRNK